LLSRIARRMSVPREQCPPLHAHTRPPALVTLKVNFEAHSSIVICGGCGIVCSHRTRTKHRSIRRQMNALSPVDRIEESRRKNRCGSGRRSSTGVLIISPETWNTFNTAAEVQAPRAQHPVSRMASRHQGPLISLARRMSSGTRPSQRVHRHFHHRDCAAVQVLIKLI
jgi:hypothetical protein